MNHRSAWRQLTSILSNCLSTSNTNLKTKRIPTILHRLSLFILAASAACAVSCASNDELQGRFDDRNDWYSNLQERRQMRQEARQERTDAWFDRVMH
jgi:hypothetical protein